MYKLRCETMSVRSDACLVLTGDFAQDRPQREVMERFYIGLSIKVWGGGMNQPSTLSGHVPLHFRSREHMLQHPTI